VHDTDPDAERQARIGLSWLCEPDDAVMWHHVLTHGPVETYRILTESLERWPEAGMRHEMRTVPAAHRLAAVTDAVATHHASPHVLTPEDPQWPAAVTDQAATAPDTTAATALCLWVRGNLQLADTLARSVTVTGSAAPTAYGLHVATALADGLARDGWTVVAGGRYGIDTAVHHTVLSGGAPTVAVLSGGTDRAHPHGNHTLFDDIAAQGLLVTRRPPDAAVSPQRIRADRWLRAALTRGTVVVEAARRSRALDTLHAAAVLGRPAMVVPGPVTSALSAGIHQALRIDRRVRVVHDLADVLADLATTAVPRGPGPDHAAGTPTGEDRR
jgi:DNA processing protein